MRSANSADSERGVLQERGSLKSRVLSASAWSIGGHGLGMALRLALNLVMTRLLVPDSFGLVAIALVILFGLSMFSDIGLAPSIFRSTRGTDSSFLNTAWTVQILRGVIIWAVALAISVGMYVSQTIGAAPGNSVYADNRLPLVVAVISFGAVISGLNSTKIYEARRHLLLGRLTLIEIISQLAGAVCTIIWVSVDRSVWALVSGATCTFLVTMLLSHVWLPGTRNSLRWDSAAWREILDFGRWIFASSTLGFLAANSDRLLLGGLIDANLLGVYSVAFNIFSVLDQIFVRVITSVAFPALSEVVRERPKELERVYYRFHHGIAAIAYFGAGAMTVAGAPLINWLYDPRYSEAGWMVQVLAVALLATPSLLAVQVFLALGRPKLHSVILLVRLVTLLTAMLLGFALFGLQGALWGLVLSALVALPIVVAYQLRLGFFSLRYELMTLPVFLIGVLAGEVLSFAIERLPRM